METGEQRTLHNGKLHDLYASTNTVQVTKLSMKLAGHVARMGDRLLVQKPVGRDHLEN